MREDSRLSRRGFLRVSSLGVAGGLAGALASKPVVAAVREACGLTPPQTEGPFYPTPDQVDSQVDADADLTWVRGRPGKARGQVIYVRGIVADPLCRPVAGALVEVWQACESGRYDHPSDPNTDAPLDPDFQYWGKAVTDADGRYVFKTIIPGAYPAAPGWMRPPHLHFKAHALGYHEVTTQMYFAGHPLNAADRILRAVPRGERERVVVRFEEAPPPHERGSRIGTFDLVLRPVE